VVLGGSSDYLVVDVGGAAGGVRVGDALTFSLNYGALLAAMTSAYVKKRCVSEGSREKARETHPPAPQRG
jgi:predicted amino acid racemase